jgi:hypothetical protein
VEQRPLQIQVMAAAVTQQELLERLVLLLSVP